MSQLVLISVIIHFISPNILPKPSCPFSAIFISATIARVKLHFSRKIILGLGETLLKIVKNFSVLEILLLMYSRNAKIIPVLGKKKKKKF